MKKIFYTTLIIFGLILMACPYEGKVELNSYEEAVKVDKKLLGEWVSFNEDGSKDELSITKLEKAVLQVYHKQFGKNNRLESRDSYRIYASEIGSYEIFNIEKKDGKYLYAKYGWTGKNEIYIQFIKEDFLNTNFKEDSVTTENLRNFITENVNKEAMFSEKIEFYRKHSPEYNMVKAFMRKSGF